VVKGGLRGAKSLYARTTRGAGGGMRIFLSLFVAGLVAVGMVLALKYYQMPFDTSWVVGVAGVIAALMWVLLAKKKA
jgi:hypothetical protein